MTNDHYLPPMIAAQQTNEELRRTLGPIEWAQQTAAKVAGSFYLFATFITVATLNACVALQLLRGATYLQAAMATELPVLAQVLIVSQRAGLLIAFVSLGFGWAMFGYFWFKLRHIPWALAAMGIFSSLGLALVTLVITVLPASAAVGLAYLVPLFIYEVILSFRILVTETPASHVTDVAAPLGRANPNRAMRLSLVA
jgi:hypothetical protein